MGKYTKKWEKDFKKRYSNAIDELQSLENEYNEMVATNPDNWFDLKYIMPDSSTVNFDVVDGSPTVKYNELTDESEENIEVQFGSGIGFFYFKMKNFEDLIKFRNDLIEKLDKFNRPVEEKRELITDDCEEEDENWEDNEEQEYTIQCSRTCVQTWTHTVMARSTCEAYRKAQEGEGHDENDDYDDYGEIDYESI